MDYTNVLVLLIKNGHIDLDNKGLAIGIQMMNKTLYMLLYPTVNKFYEARIEASDLDVIKSMNNLAKIINEFKYNNAILKSKMYEYVMRCYEMWSVISLNEKLKSKLIVPKTPYFKEFLCERRIDMSDIFPDCATNYTHYHHQTQTSSGFKQISFR